LVLANVLQRLGRMHQKPHWKTLARNGNERGSETRRPAQYQTPLLRRWGSLRELTSGGGGWKNEPTTKRDTRF
jgi:hypothetical protein